jgi:hypothetical protein
MFGKILILSENPRQGLRYDIINLFQRDDPGPGTPGPDALHSCFPGGPAMPDLFEKCLGDGGNFGFLRQAGDDYFCHPVLDPEPGHHMTWAGSGRSATSRMPMAPGCSWTTPTAWG